VLERQACPGPSLDIAVAKDADVGVREQILRVVAEQEVRRNRQTAVTGKETPGAEHRLGRRRADRLLVGGDLCHVEVLDPGVDGRAVEGCPTTVVLQLLTLREAQLPGLVPD